MSLSQCYFPVLILAAVTLPLAGQTPAPVILKFANLRPDASSVPAYVTFGGGGNLTGVSLANHTPLVRGTSYRMSDLSAGVAISNFADGRVYFSLGAPLTTATEQNAYSPNFVDATLPDFRTRWDKIEFNLGRAGTGLAGGANLSAQDFFGLPLRIDSDGGGDAPAKLTWRETTANAFTKLGTLAGDSVNTPENRSGAFVLGNNGVALDNVKGGEVIRVVAPSTVVPIGDGSTVYPSLSNYISYLQTGNKNSPGQPIQTILHGHNGQLAGGIFQVYNLNATILNAPATIAGTSFSAGDLLFQGTVNNGAGDLPTVIRVPKSSLTDYAIFGANPTWIPVQLDNTNSIAEKVVADYFAALNFGLAGSPVDNPVMRGTTIGDSPSWTWYGNMPNGQGVNPLAVTDAFASAEPAHTDRYMQYAAYLTTVSDAYGFAYNDRLQSPLASFTDGATMTISILPDTQPGTVTAPAPVIVASAATPGERTALAPGSIASVLGEIPVSSKVFAPGASVTLPFRLGALQAAFDDKLPAPLFAAHPKKALIQIPWELGTQTASTFRLSGRGQSSRAEQVTIAEFVPAIFTTNAEGTGQGQIVDVNDRLVDEKNAALSGAVIVIYCTGLGPVHNQPPTGAPSPFAPLAETRTQPVVKIGGRSAVVLYSGLTPGQVGLYQINVVIPEGLISDTATPVEIDMKGVTSNRATFAIAAPR